MSIHCLLFELHCDPFFLHYNSKTPRATRVRYVTILGALIITIVSYKTTVNENKFTAFITTQTNVNYRLFNMYPYCTFTY